MVDIIGWGFLILFPLVPDELLPPAPVLVVPPPADDPPPGGRPLVPSPGPGGCICSRWAGRRSCATRVWVVQPLLNYELGLLVVLATEQG